MAHGRRMTSGPRAVRFGDRPAAGGARWLRAISCALHSDTLRVGALSVGAGLVLWHVASTIWLVSILFPSPLATGRAWVEMLLGGDLLYHVGVSLLRIAIGFVIGTAIGIPIGLCIGLFRPIRVFLEPFVQFFRFVPPIAWIVPAILWFGIGETSKIFLIFYTSVFLVLLNTAAGVASIPRNQLRAARTFGANPAQLFLWVSLPATMPYVITGMRLAMGNSFVAVVGAEFIAAEAGLGWLITESGAWMATERMFAAMLTLGVLGMVADRVFRGVVGRWGSRFLIRA
jgi:NitT/TauT family transport system permease protein